jgi:hypothetical protein
MVFGLSVDIKFLGLYRKPAVGDSPKARGLVVFSRSDCPNGTTSIVYGNPVLRPQLPFPNQRSGYRIEWNCGALGGV